MKGRVMISMKDTVSCIAARQAVLAGLAGICTLLAGCNAGDAVKSVADLYTGGISTSNNTPPPAFTVSGSVIAGPVGGSTLTISSVNADGSTGTSLGSTTTASDGSFSVSLSVAPSGAIRLTATNGSYTSEANTTTTVSNVALSALVPSVPSSGASGLVVTALSTFSDQRAQALIAANGSESISSASTAADTNIKAVYGIRDTSTPLSTLVPSFTTSSGDPATIALTLGALEQLALQLGKPPEQIVSAIAQDLTDGVLDGKVAGGNPIKYQSSDTSAAPSTLGSTLFLNAVSAYTAAGNTATIAAQNKVTYTAPTITAVRSGVVAYAAASSGLDVNSSGAITSLTYVDSSNATHQIVFLAAAADGLRALDVTNPASITVVNLNALNSQLVGGTTPVMPSVDGVISVPVGSGNPQLLLFSYGSPTVALVDAVADKLLTSQSLGIASTMNCSGRMPYVSGGIIDTVAAVPTIWLTTASGYMPVSIGANNILTAMTPVDTVNGIGMPENVGASVTDRILFSPAYCSFTSASSTNGNPGLVLVNLDTKTPYSLDATDYSGAFGSPGEPDSGAVDSVLKVGVVVEEHSQSFSFINLNNLSSSASFSFDATSGTFTPANPSKQLLSVNLTDFTRVSGVNINSTSHLAFLLEELGADGFGVAALDDPNHPANATAGWAGFVDYRWQAGASSKAGSPTTFCAGGDPHSEATISHFSNGRIYGFALNTCDTRPGTTTSSGAIVVDMQNFLNAAASGSTHQLASNPFADSTIIQMLKF